MVMRLNIDIAPPVCISIYYILSNKYRVFAYAIQLTLHHPYQPSRADMDLQG
jgi:hypothetical protein